MHTLILRSDVLYDWQTCEILNYFKMLGSIEKSKRVMLDFLGTLLLYRGTKFSRAWHFSAPDQLCPFCPYIFDLAAQPQTDPPPQKKKKKKKNTTDNQQNKTKQNTNKHTITPHLTLPKINCATGHAVRH